MLLLIPFLAVTVVADETSIQQVEGAADLEKVKRAKFRLPPEFVGRSEVYLANVGEATLVMEFLDGKTGEVLARIS